MVGGSHVIATTAVSDANTAASDADHAKVTTTQVAATDQTVRDAVMDNSVGKCLGTGVLFNPGMQRRVRLQAAAIVALIVLMDGVAFAQNPCSDPLPTLTTIDIVQKSIVMAISDYDVEIDGMPLWTATEFKVVARGASPDAAPVVPSQVAVKSAWTLVTADCYSIPGPFLSTVPPNIELELYTRNYSDTTVGPWSTNSVVFMRPVAIECRYGTTYYPIGSPSLQIESTRQQYPSLKLALEAENWVVTVARIQGNRYVLTATCTGV